VIVSDPALSAAAREIAGRHGGTVVTLDGDGGGELAELAAGMSPTTRPSAGERRPCRPSLHLGHHRALEGSDDHPRQSRVEHHPLHEAWRFVPGDVLLHALPIFHVHGLYVALGTAFLNRSEILWHQKFDADAVMRDLPRATVMMGVPTFYTRLVMRDDLTADSLRPHAAVRLGLGAIAGRDP
jgi:malonyl-CoA/methylmalonyl-CoA synthetase